MQDLIKRYFWVVGALVVATCAVFAAKATGHVLEAKVLADPAEKAKIERPPPLTPTPQQPKSTRTKDGTQLSQRNMFCSECTPAVVIPTNPTDGSVVTVTSAEGLPSRTAAMMRSFTAATRSIGRVRLTATTRSTNSTPAAWRVRNRSSATTPGTRVTAAVILLAAPAGAVSVRVSIVRRPSRHPAMQMKIATTIAAAESADG